MLKRLYLRNFTVFADAEFEFGPGLNVLVGTNGTGKTHVLKAGYSVLYSFLEQVWESIGGVTLEELSIKEGHATASMRKVANVFRPVPFQLNELIRRSAKITEAKVELTIAGPDRAISG